MRKRSTFCVAKVLLCALFASVGGSALCQSAFQKKVLLVNTGPVLLGRSTDIAISGEYGVRQRVGVGLRTTSGYLTNRSIYSGINTSAFINYHLFKFQRVDPFVGIAGGKTTYKADREAAGTDNYTGFQLIVQGGGRYLISNRVGVYAQGALSFRRDVMPTVEVGASLKLGNLR